MPIDGDDLIIENWKFSTAFLSSKDAWDAPMRLNELVSYVIFLSTC